MGSNQFLIRKTDPTVSGNICVFQKVLISNQTYKAARLKNLQMLKIELRLRSHFGSSLKYFYLFSEEIVFPACGIHHRKLGVMIDFSLAINKHLGKTVEKLYQFIFQRHSQKKMLVQVKVTSQICMEILKRKDKTGHTKRKLPIVKIKE